MKTEYMIDIETLAVPESLPAGALVEVVEIAAVKFCGDKILDEILLYPMEGNGLCSADTVLFWMRRDQRPQWLIGRMEAESPEELPSMENCLKVLRAFLGDHRRVIWSKGRFDMDILGAHYAANQMPRPWEYYNLRDLRTAMKEAEVAQPYGQVTHNALEDARMQVELLSDCRGRKAEVVA